jgi:hypothetical protein
MYIVRPEIPALKIIFRWAIRGEDLHHDDRNCCPKDMDGSETVTFLVVPSALLWRDVLPPRRRLGRFDINCCGVYIFHIARFPDLEALIELNKPCAAFLPHLSSFWLFLSWCFGDLNHSVNCKFGGFFIAN